MKFADKTRGGYPVRLLTDENGEYVIDEGCFIVGAVKYGDWIMRWWHKDGTIHDDRGEIDLVPLSDPQADDRIAALEARIAKLECGAKQEPEKYAYVNVYRMGDGRLVASMASRLSADDMREASYRVSRIRIPLVAGQWDE